MRRTLFLAASLALAVAIVFSQTPGRADVLVMKDGTRVEGKIIHENEQSVTVLFLRDGNEATVMYPRSRIASIVREERTSRERLVDEYHERARALTADDAGGWWNLALWAGERGLAAERKEALERVLELDPEHAQAREALGFKKLDDRWLPAAEVERLLEERRREKLKAEVEARRAAGYVEWEGAWYKPEELQALAAMKQAVGLGGLAERMEAMDARLAKLSALEADAIAGRFDRLERGLQTLADALNAELVKQRAQNAEEHATIRARLTEISLVMDQLRQELQDLRREVAGRGR